MVQVYLANTAGLVPDYRRKADIAVKQVTCMFPIENRIGSCYNYSTGLLKKNPIRYGQCAIFIQSNVNISLT